MISSITLDPVPKPPSTALGWETGTIGGGSAVKIIGGGSAVMICGTGAGGGSCFGGAGMSFAPSMQTTGSHDSESQFLYRRS